MLIRGVGDCAMPWKYPLAIVGMLTHVGLQVGLQPSSEYM